MSNNILMVDYVETGRNFLNSSFDNDTVFTSSVAVSGQKDVRCSIVNIWAASLNYLFRYGYVFTPTEEYTFNIIFAAMFVFTIVANVITFLVIRRTPSLKKSVFNMFLTSLCISDILSALISPIIVYRKISGYYNFALPEFFCKIPVAVEYWTSCVTMQHVLLVSAFRLVAIQYPHKVKSITRLHAKIMIVSIWTIMGIVGALPYVFIVIRGERSGPNGEPTSTCLMNKKWFYILKNVRIYGYPFIWYIPMILVIIMSVLLAFLLLKRKHSGPSNNNDNKEIKAIVQLAVIIASFFLGYFPDLGFRMFIIIFRGRYGNVWMPRYAWIMSVMSHFLMRLSECLNPLLYNLASNQIWSATKMFFEEYKCRKRKAARAEDSTTKKHNGSSTTQRTSISKFTQIKLPINEKPQDDSKL